MLDVTHRFTFGAIVPRAMGTKGETARRRRTVADVLLRWLEPGPATGQTRLSPRR
jgi:hypothetical protein